ncbi:hypothetical protein AB0B28_02840 [Glycomyces sp. NPDC046736]|uniref:hypothetical protein n=1 Tax=Glycomyces sp. NPDC046736 TaxID=3155615 RepID=UPI003409BF66
MNRFLQRNNAPLDPTFVLGKAWIGGRFLRFDASFSQSRIRVTFAGVDTIAVGSVIYLDTDLPALRVSSPIDAEWAGLHCAEIIDEAKRIWAEALRECNG